MTLKSGDLENDNKAPQNDVAALTEMVLKLQKQFNEAQRQLLEVKAANTHASPGSQVNIVEALANYQATFEKARDIDYQAGIDAKDIPTDDYDEEGVTFCAPFTGYVISDDKRQGHRVMLPYNKPYIVFEFQGSRPIQEGKHVKLMNLCTYRSQSKKEIEWIRNYTFFNTIVYESTRGVMNFDVLKAQKLAKIMTNITNWEMPQVIARCKEYGVPIDQDLAVMRTNVAMKMADAELARDKDSTHNRLAELEKEKALLQSRV
jgi:hypothetical protein